MNLPNIDTSALFKIEYGLYVLTTSDGEKDNGCIVDAVMQVTSTPERVAVAVNKDNYSHELILKTGKFNLNCICKSAPFELFKNFGFQSGRTADKFDGVEFWRSENGIPVLIENVNAFISLSVESTVDLGTHTLFICDVTLAREISDEETITYSYYRSHTKNTAAQKKKGFICTVCGYVHEGDELPDDFVCPICKQGADAFKEIQ